MEKSIAKGPNRNKALEEGITLYLGQKEFEVNFSFFIYIII